MIKATDFRDAMALLPTAVNVVTTDGIAGAHGFTASAVCSVTDTPPTLLVCMNTTSRSHAHFIDNKVLSVNVLGAQHEQISNTFASKLCSEQRFTHGAWTKLTTGAPILADAPVSFDCEITDVQEVGTHSVFMCKVIAIRHGGSDSDASLVYFKRSYHPIGKHEIGDQEFGVQEVGEQEINAHEVDAHEIDVQTYKTNIA